MKSGKSLLMLSVLAIVSLFCSFTSPAGSEGFEIYLDNKNASKCQKRIEASNGGLLAEIVNNDKKPVAVK